jgi:hypothetical protein
MRVRSHQYRIVRSRAGLASCRVVRRPLAQHHAAAAPLSLRARASQRAAPGVDASAGAVTFSLGRVTPSTRSCHVTLAASQHT